jgi:hypothetical protein
MNVSQGLGELAFEDVELGKNCSIAVDRSVLRVANLTPICLSHEILATSRRLCLSLTMVKVVFSLVNGINAVFLPR